MPQVAIFFLMLLFSPMLTNSHAFIPVDLNNIVDTEHEFTFNSDIIQIDSDFFVENNDFFIHAYITNRL